MTKDEARAKLMVAFNALKSGGNGQINDGVVRMFEAADVKTKEDAIICCTALYAFITEMPIENANPHAEVGIDLYQAISMFAWLAIDSLCEGLGYESLEDYEQHIPEWIH